MDNEQQSITCPNCDRTSYSKGDIVNKYCGFCQRYHREFTMIKEGISYNVRYGLGYDINYENNVKCVKVCPKSWRMEREDGTTFLVAKDSVFNLEVLNPRG